MEYHRSYRYFLTHVENSVQLSPNEIFGISNWLSDYDFDYEIDYGDPEEVLLKFQSKIHEDSWSYLDLSHREVRCIARVSLKNPHKADLNWWAFYDYSNTDKDEDDLDILTFARFLLILDNEGFDYLVNIEDNTVKILATNTQGNKSRYFEVSNFIMSYQVDSEREARNKVFMERNPDTTDDEFDEGLIEYDRNKNESAEDLLMDIYFIEFNRVRALNDKSPISKKEWLESNE